MTNLDYKEKLLGVIKHDDEHKIVVSHVTIRQSIFFLVIRIMAIELIAATALITFHIFFFNPQLQQGILGSLAQFNIPVFIFLVIAKSALLIFIIMQWVDEYYEITTKDVVYRRGFFIKKEDRHKLEHIGYINLEQGALGRMFNYGTVKLFNWTTEKEILLYLIHNPRKYQHILEELLPEADKSKKVFRDHILEPDDDSL